MDPQDLMLTALRASLVYFYLLLVVRILGKREVGNTTAFDFIVALMLGEVVDEAIFGDVSMVKGLLAITVIGAWHLINSWASYKSKLIEKITCAEPTELVKSGKFIKDALAKERINEAEVFSEMRQMGIEDLKEVKTATLEPNGKISFIQEEWAKTLQKGDLKKARA
jgi:uncharacterized membrane protein YcaP (DUF421 family)